MLKTNINLKLLLFGLGVLIIAAVFVFKIELLTFVQKEKEEIKVPEIITEEIQEEVLYIIDKGDGYINSYNVSLSRGSTVFSLLEELAKNKNFEIESTIYKELGVFVESINGFKNGTNNNYWQYWVNGELPMVAADKKEIKGGDIVEWKFAPSPF